jgi:intein/homing endonuclease
LRVGGIDLKFEDFVDVNSLVDGFNNVVVNVDTLGRTVPAKVYSAGIKPCTTIKFEGGEFEAANHPIMVVNADGNLEWRIIEDIKVGDTVLVQDAA